MNYEMRGIIEAQQIERRRKMVRGEAHPVRNRAGLEVGTDVQRSVLPGPPALRPDRSRPVAVAALPQIPVATARTVTPRVEAGRCDPFYVRALHAIVPVNMSIIGAIPVALVLLARLLPVLGAFDVYASDVGLRVEPATVSELVSGVQEESGRGGDGSFNVDATAFEQIRRTEYRVRPGDTISEIAVRYGLDAGTILSMNPIDDVRRLLPGTLLSIPDRDGLFHAVQPGESLSSISGAYRVPIYAILDANNLATDVLKVGDTLFIPGARMPAEEYLLAIGELLSWPVRSFRFTSGFGMRVDPITRQWRMHNGIDLANATGTPVLAARGGRVVHTEPNSGTYGNLIIIDHGSGVRTLYAHLNSIAVNTSQWVSTGQLIGRMGNTGRSTGPHLHFSVIRNGRWEDPLRHLANR